MRYGGYKGLGGEDSFGGNDGIECYYVAAMVYAGRGWFGTAVGD